MKAALGVHRVQISGSTPNFTVVFQQKKISLTRYEQYTEADTKFLNMPKPIGSGSGSGIHRRIQPCKSHAAS